MMYIHHVDRLPFSLTIYIWPIQKPILICERMDYWLCNPDIEDIAILADSIKAAYYSDRVKREEELETFHETMLRQYFVESPSLISELSFKGSLDDYWLFLAANWVIIRTGNWLEPQDEFDDTRTFDVLNSYISVVDFHRGLFLQLRTNTILDKHFMPIYNTSHRLKSIFFSLNTVIFGLGYHMGHRKEGDPSEPFYVPQFALEEIKKSSEIINLSNFMHDPLTDMHFFGDLIHACFVETRNYYFKAISICSIIEYMIARNPDSSKFNVDESINKQFQMKPSLLANKYDESIDLDETAKFLKVAYELRSSISHGNFDNVIKVLNKFGDDIMEFDHKLQEIALVCFRSFLKFPEYAKFVKKS